MEDAAERELEQPAQGVDDGLLLCRPAHGGGGGAAAAFGARAAVVLVVVLVLVRAAAGRLARLAPALALGRLGGRLRGGQGRAGLGRALDQRDRPLHEEHPAAERLHLLLRLRAEHRRLQLLVRGVHAAQACEVDPVAARRVRSVGSFGRRRPRLAHTAQENVDEQRLHLRRQLGDIPVNVDNAGQRVREEGDGCRAKGRESQRETAQEEKGEERRLR